VEKQISQMKVGQSKSIIDGTDYKGKTEAGIKMEGAQKELESQQGALKASQELDAAREALKADPSQANKDAVDKAEKNAAAAGVGDRRTRDVEKDVQSASQNLGSLKEQEATALAEARDNLKIQSLRTTEKYGATDAERESARTQADALEDSKEKQQRVAELSKTISDPEKANQIADIEVKRNRIVKDIEREGTVPVSNMARIGGASGWAGMVNSNESKTKQLEELNKTQNQILTGMATKMQQSWELAKTLSER
jgi:hypothetical protein